MAMQSGPSYPPYYSGPTEKWPPLRTPRKRAAEVLWSIVLVVAFAIAMWFLVGSLI